MLAEGELDGWLLCNGYNVHKYILVALLLLSPLLCSSLRLHPTCPLSQHQQRQH